MKIKNVTLAVVICAIIFSALGYEYVCAEPKEISPAPKIAVVNVRALFTKCKKNTGYMQKINAEQDKILAELEKLNSQVEALKADLNTRKLGSKDYIGIMKEAMETQAQFEAKKEFHKRQLSMQDQLWTEQMLGEIQSSVEAVAKKDGIEMVFAKDELDLPAPSSAELMMTVRTHKLLYSAEGLDITEKVLAHLDSQAEQSKTKLKNE